MPLNSDIVNSSTLVFDLEPNYRLEPLKISDARSLNKLMIRNGRLFQQFLPVTLAENLTEEKSRNYIAKKIKQSENFEAITLGIKKLDKGTIAGLIILKEINKEKKEAELAYCIGRKYGGMGLVTKSVIEFSNFLLLQTNLKTINILIHKSNIKSIQVAKKSGFNWKGTLENEFRAPGGLMLDMELYQRNK
ncbi:GNAT family N-acetyltransferase [Aegicerativicinus sediminis]|uniref:GNAT family N-acetyltransferase n=1 Tax=Aegicerativicinus sediminis TaxID=2893202 RepID=UPI001E5A22EC|nr:GNAT family N-acetyltransferase [Aegicerativicinus sediminis]